ncbi:glycosyltransferase [Marinobacter sp. NSM]|uniref:glycosyltransferase n=1 Tax=Marinobacter sp. NSM TaxID=3458004 RepID=UPI0040364A16
MPKLRLNSFFSIRNAIHEKSGVNQTLPSVCNEMYDQRVLKFSYVRLDGKVAGRELLAENNSKMIREIFGGRLIEITARSAGEKGLVKKLVQLLGWLDGLNPALVRKCINTIREEKCNLVYIEGSNYGHLAKLIKRNCPSCRVVCFFHNVESRFFWGALCQNLSMKALGVLIANFFAERKAVKYSDEVICLTERDKEFLGRLYGKEGDHVVPISVVKPVEVSVQQPDSLPSSGQQFGLFVGGAFYANVEAVRWLAKNNLARSSCPIYVVGRGFEKYIEEFSRHENLIIVGEVESLEDWYYRSSFAIAPIFDGSGMKTKVAESLMYGRPIIATSEAFVGYEGVKESAGFVCNNPEEFESAISMILDRSRVFDSDELRVIYNSNFSYDASLKKMERILVS